MRPTSWIVGFIASVALAFGVAAAGVWPSGWSVEEKTGAVMATSPAQKNGAVYIVAGPAEPSKLALKKWFDGKIRGLAVNGATIKQRSGIVAEDVFLKDALELRSPTAPPSRIWAFAYDTKDGRQMILQISPFSVPQNDPRMIAALDTIADMGRAAMPLQAAISQPKSNVAANAVAKPKPQSNAQAPSGGKPRCREEMRTITSSTLQQVCYPSVGGMSNCQLQAVPVQQQVLQEVCY